MWVESTVLASILFSYASGHNKHFSAVHIQRVPQLNQLFHDKAKYFLWKTQFTHTHTHRVIGNNNGDHGMKTSEHPWQQKDYEWWQLTV